MVGKLNSNAINNNINNNNINNNNINNNNININNDNNNTLPITSCQTKGNVKSSYTGNRSKYSSASKSTPT